MRRLAIGLVACLSVLLTTSSAHAGTDGQHDCHKIDHGTLTVAPGGTCAWAYKVLPAAQAPVSNGDGTLTITDEKKYKIHVAGRTLSCIALIGDYRNVGISCLATPYKYSVWIMLDVR